MPLGPTSYAQALLPASHWHALDQAGGVLVDWTLDGLVALATTGTLHDSDILAYLPTRALTDYTVDVLRHFLVTLISIGVKQRLPEFHQLQCTGEEIALVATIELAAALLEEQSESADFTAWFAHVCVHPDVLRLYGVAEHETPRAGLQLVAWFRPFAGSHTHHPYLDSESGLW